jgi:hypothetical protein
MTETDTNTTTIGGNGCLGRIAAKSDPRALHLVNFLMKAPADLPDPPKRTTFWTKRAQFEPETWGNDQYGCCTIAKQANMFRRFERLERKQTIAIAAEEVVSKYFAMTTALYGGGDTGAYETDALDRSRREETCLRDTRNHPLLIDAYVRVDASDHIALRRAIAMAAGHGIAICINLPAAFQQLSTVPWDIPDGQQPVGEWQAGTWGGHSMWAVEYDEFGILLEHTWKRPPQRLSWRAAALYLDEAHLVIDSADAWRKKTKGQLDVGGIVDAVNAVSSKKIAA